MGCITSKFTVLETNNDTTIYLIDEDSPRHIVSLTSSTYGLLKLDIPDELEDYKVRPSPFIVPFRKSTSKEEPLEIINAWELMGDLEDDDDLSNPNAITSVPISTPAKKIQDRDRQKHIIAPFSTPRKPRRLAGKENSPENSVEASPFDRKRASNPLSPIENTQSIGRTPSSIRRKTTPSLIGLRIQVPGKDWFSCSSRRCSLTPMFDPELVASFERELQLEREREQIKTVISSTPRNRKPTDPSAALLESYEPLCPRGGADSVVMYTTTLRGIRKTFEDCNSVRAAIEACGVQFLERDISMDSGYREELRVLMGKKEVKVPVIFVKGRLIGGAAEILRLEEGGRLELLLSGFPRAAAEACDGCGGMRFVLCLECSGSCKVMDGEEGKVVKCGECNENGLIRCPICC